MIDHDPSIPIDWSPSALRLASALSELFLDNLKAEAERRTREAGEPVVNCDDVLDGYGYAVETIGLANMVMECFGPAKVDEMIAMVSRMATANR